MKCYVILSLAILLQQSFAKEVSPVQLYRWNGIKYDFETPKFTGYNVDHDYAVGIEILKYDGFFLSVSHIQTPVETSNGSMSALNFISRSELIHLQILTYKFNYKKY